MTGETQIGDIDHCNEQPVKCQSVKCLIYHHKDSDLFDDLANGLLQFCVFYNKPHL